jgi:general secretion pathway protein E/type IV pilus assembly protein PilB
MEFSDGLKSLMRQDPDIIFLGEIRDLETASMAIRASMTGHQVFTTLHTNDAIGAISRLQDIGISNSLMSGNIVCIIAQRLARKLCNHCKEEHLPTSQEQKILGIKKDRSIFQKKGCEECEFVGYKGRIAICEIFKVDQEIDEMISQGASRKNILEYATTHGFKRMIDDGVEKVLAGVTDLNSLMGTIDITERII